jgi:exonuclease III
LAAAARSDSRRLIWAGDFNFTPDPHLDRRSLARTPLRRTTCASDRSSQACFSLLVPSITDLWRHAHPTRRAFTFTNGSVCARLDRVYVSTELLPYSTSPTISRRPLADHCPVSGALLGTLPASHGRQRRRVRLGFLSSTSLTQEFTDWLADRPLPDDPVTLLL